MREGKTTKIFVSRYRLVDDAMEEILREDPPAIVRALKIMVIQGKFLGMVMREIRDKLFKEEREGYIIFEKKEALNREHFQFVARPALGYLHKSGFDQSGGSGNLSRTCSARRRVDCSIYLHSILKFVTGWMRERACSGFQNEAHYCFLI
ncbi:hypothetical protein pdam_00018084 [Pocillopora damicornis]|uniref:Uncharacterized protein n=1 Tax=Pocillopora damicornis TaxID=46731 RepID=A0A3M6V5X7_POCDA|nr:hypothetical protein pdam_00018084 [Pocillopora damicornis]